MGIKAFLIGTKAFLKGCEIRFFVLILLNFPLLLNPNPGEPNQCGSMLIRILNTVYTINLPDTYKRITNL